MNRAVEPKANVYEGKSIYGGIAIGKIHIYKKDEHQVKRYKIEDVEAEIQRYEQAKQQVISNLNDLYEKALVEVGEVNAQIFEIHAMMLEDNDYNDSVHNIITTQMVNAEYAVALSGDNFSAMFEAIEGEYFKARAIDVKDISEQVVATLLEKESKQVLAEPVILLANDLAPSETVQMDKNYLLGFVTKLGTANSHTAILARTMNIPALVQVEIQDAWDGKMAVIDGFNGTFIVDPDEETLQIYQQRQLEEAEKTALLQEYKGKETISKSGKKIHLYANIGGIGDLNAVLENDAEGIGLFRSEFLYLEQSDYPTEELQFLAYKQVVETMADKKVIIRTLDIGADKKVDYFNLAEEVNPAMGKRAIRICLSQPEIFKTQMRAILRAAVYGNISVMYPMITSVWEVQKIKEIVAEVQQELKAQEIPYGTIEQGIMVETPAAVMISDLLAKEVDFFSIGTNDLTQYTLAVDRQNNALDAFYDPHHEAVLRMIRMVVDAGHAAGIWVGICGELGADTTLTDTFMEMGVDELSVSPTAVLRVRKTIMS